MALSSHEVTALQPISNVATFEPDAASAETAGSGNIQRAYRSVAVGEVEELYRDWSSIRSRQKVWNGV